MDIEQQYETVTELKKCDVNELANWIDSQPHLPQTNEKLLILFLSSCFFDLEKTKKCVEYYYTIRSSYNAVFSQRNPFLDKNLQVMDVFICEPMATLTPEGYGVFYSKILDPALDKYDFQTQVKLFDMRLHVWLQQVGCVKGLVTIVDMTGSTMRHVQRMGYFNVKKVIGYLTEGLPIRLKAVHFVHPTSFIEACFQILYPMISAELREFLHVHTTESSLFEYLPHTCVPDELGGKGGSIKSLHNEFVESLKNNCDYFTTDEQMKSDESKRVKQGLFKRLGW